MYGFFIVVAMDEKKYRRAEQVKNNYLKFIINVFANWIKNICFSYGIIYSFLLK